MPKKAEKYSWQLFNAEAAYAESIFLSSLGNIKGSIAALKQALKVKPDYAPAIYSMGTVEYRRNRKARGHELLFSLLTLPEETTDLLEIIDEAGDFLIDIKDYGEGLEFYRAAAARFPETAVFHQGIGCCAGHEGQHEEAIRSSRRAIELEPENQKFWNDLGWTLFEAGELEEAQKTLERAISMDPSDRLARTNLRYCKKKIAGQKKKPKDHSNEIDEH